MSKPDKKIYPSAVLKNLTPPKQESLLLYCDGDGTPENPAHSLKQTVAWLKDDGIVSSNRAVSDWRSWYLLRRQMDLNEQAAQEFVQDLKQDGTVTTPEQEFAAGQKFFTRLAMVQQDNLGFVRVLREATRKESVKMERVRIETLTCEKFLEWFKDKKAVDIAESNISTPDKVAKLRQLYFADVDAMEQSGDVKLPE